MNYYIRCNNCGKVAKYPYPSNIVGDDEANKAISREIEADGWITISDHDKVTLKEVKIIHTQEFCCKECYDEWLEHYKRTGATLNLPAAYKFQEQLRNNSN